MGMSIHGSARMSSLSRHELSLAFSIVIRVYEWNALRVLWVEGSPACTDWRGRHISIRAPKVFLIADVSQKQLAFSTRREFRQSVGGGGVGPQALSDEWTRPVRPL